MKLSPNQITCKKNTFLPSTIHRFSFHTLLSFQVPVNIISFRETNKTKNKTKQLLCKEEKKKERKRKKTKASLLIFCSVREMEQASAVSVTEKKMQWHKPIAHWRSPLLFTNFLQFYKTKVDPTYFYCAPRFSWYFSRNTWMLCVFHVQLVILSAIKEPIMKILWLSDFSDETSK